MSVVFNQNAMLNALEGFHREVAMQVCADYPEWEVIASVDQSDGAAIFVLSVTPPNCEIAYPLRIDTSNDEVTVSFDAYHAHFYDYRDGTDFDAATFISGIVSGVYVVVSYWQDDRWRGSTFVEGGNIPSDNERHPDANRIRVRSWSGELDRDIPCISKSP